MRISAEYAPFFDLAVVTVLFSRVTFDGSVQIGPAATDLQVRLIHVSDAVPVMLALADSLVAEHDAAEQEQHYERDHVVSVVFAFRLPTFLGGSGGTGVALMA